MEASNKNNHQIARAIRNAADRLGRQSKHVIGSSKDGDCFCAAGAIGLELATLRGENCDGNWFDYYIKNIDNVEFVPSHMRDQNDLSYASKQGHLAHYNDTHTRQETIAVMRARALELETQ